MKSKKKSAWEKMQVELISNSVDIVTEFWAMWKFQMTYNLQNVQ